MVTEQVISVIGSDEEPVNDQDIQQWIGVGKVFENVPEHIREVFRSKIKVPKHYESYLPQNSLPVIEFIQFPLPETPENSLLSPSLDFSKEPPSFRDLKLILAHTLPDVDHLRQVKRTLGQKWLDGYRSVTNPNWGNARLPLSAISYMDQIMSLTISKNHWRDSVYWLRDHQTRKDGFNGLAADDTVNLFESAHHTLSVLPWNMPIPGYTGFTTNTLSICLSNRWLNDDIIDLALENISSRMKNTPSAPKKVLVASHFFGCTIEQAYQNSRWDAKFAPLLCQYTKKIKEESYSDLYTVVNINNSHWISLRIDFARREISYGDSLDNRMAPPTQLIKAVSAWLRISFPVDKGSKKKSVPKNDRNGFKDIGNTIVHGHQSDVFSCGIAALNSISHVLFGDPIFNDSRKFGDRLRLFEMATTMYRQKQEVPITDDHIPEHQMILLTKYPDINVDLASSDHNFSKKEILDIVSDDDKLESQGKHTSTHPFLNVAVDDTSTAPRTVTTERYSDPILPESNSAMDFDMLVDANSSDGMEAVIVPYTTELSSSDDVDSKSYASQQTDMSRLDTEVNLSGMMEKHDRHGSKLHSSKSLPEQKLRFRAGEKTSDIEMRDLSESDNYLSDKECTEKERLSRKRRKSDDSYVHNSAPGHSWVTTKKRRDAYLNGRAPIDPLKYKRYLGELRAIDKDVVVNQSNILRARHSVCGKFYAMTDLYDASRFRQHCLRDCKPNKSASARTPTLSSFFANPKTQSSADKPRLKITAPVIKLKQPPVVEKEILPCGGLTEEHDSRIAVYFERPSAEGGGADSIYKKAEEKHELYYRELTLFQKEALKKEAKHNWAWRKDNTSFCVFATDCLKEVEVEKDRSNKEELPACENCLKLLKDRRFINVVRRRKPASKDLSHVNNEYRNQHLGEMYANIKGVGELLAAADKQHRSPYLQFAQGVLDGDYDNYQVFLGMVEAMVSKVNRVKRGKGLQNMQYQTVYDDLMQSVSYMCPRVHRLLSGHIQTRTLKNIRIKESRKPRFPLTLETRCFERVKLRLERINYSGPLCLSCDEVKLLESWRVYHDKDQDAHYLVGGIGDPSIVADPEEFRQVVEEQKLRLATKLRVYVLQTPLPKVPPIIVAAKAVPDNRTGSDNLNDEHYVLNGLIDAGCNIVSIATDGASTEREMQRRFVAEARNHRTVVIPHPAGLEPLKVPIPIYHGHHMIPIQDSKHALKTARNNNFSGARVLTLGNHVATYSFIRDIALQENSPLYGRDVERSDKQDDNAASRHFCEKALTHVVKYNPEQRGQIAYNFVFGEFIDAFQNQHIPHITRLEMVFQARFFFDIWEEFLAHAGYAPNRHYISREANEIARNLINGYVALVVIYRDHCDGIWPLLPWLHSSEPCEHIFGECRKLIPDFTHLDFVYMIPKIETMIDSFMYQKDHDPRARASGYAHTYLDSSSIDLVELANFPSDFEIEKAAKTAWSRVITIWSFLGVTVADLGLKRRQAGTSSGQMTVAATYNTMSHEVSALKMSYTRDDLDDILNLESDDEEASILGEVAEFQELLDEYEGLLDEEYTEDENVLNVICANLAVTFNESEAIHSLPEATDEELEEYLNQQRLSVQEILSSVEKSSGKKTSTSLLQAEAAEQARNNLSGVEWPKRNLNTSVLIEERRKHQTEAAAKGVCTRDGAALQNSEQSIRNQLNRRFQEVVRMQQDQGVGTGLERRTRHNMATSQAKNSGNAANAKVVGQLTTTKLLQNRIRCLQDAHIPSSCFETISDARINKISHLSAGKYIFAFFNGEMMIGHVISLYSRSGGKRGAHSWVLEVDNVTAVSYAVVQLFPYLQDREFRCIPAPPRIQVKLFALLTSMNIVSLLHSNPAIDAEKGDLEISEVDFQTFSHLDTDQVLTAMSGALTNFNKRNKNDEDKA